MSRIPFDIGAVHIIGIGGIGMSGIAEVMHNLGYEVQGSDAAENANVARLRALGISVAIGQSPDNLGAAGVVVISSAIRPDNPELLAARERSLPIVRRAEMLAELMRLKWCVSVAGTHGKTTTTSLVACLLDAGGVDPTVINGGIVNAYGTNARLGTGEWMVVEADESDGTFVKLPATLAVVTNIDPEHLDFYGGFDGLRSAFEAFVENIPFYGCAIVCIDHPEVQALIGRVRDRRFVTYGTSPQADLRAINICTQAGGSNFDLQITDRLSGEVNKIANIRTPMPGLHNVRNSLAALAVAGELGISWDVARDALRDFAGVKRRFTQTGIWNGCAIIDDYGHHPVEIASALQAAREICSGRIIAVVQPHRYSRLSELFEEFCTCFNDADTVIVADVHAAGETPIPGIDRDGLVQGIRDHGHRHVIALPDAGALAGIIRDEAKPGDIVLCLGAGSVTQWANALPGELNETACQAGAG